MNERVLAIDHRSTTTHPARRAMLGLVSLLRWAPDSWLIMMQANRAIRVRRALMSFH